MPNCEHFRYVSKMVSLVSLERFRVTRLTVQRSRPYTLKQRVAVLAVSWMISVALPSFNLYFVRLKKLKRSYRCVFSKEHSSYVWFVILYIYIIVSVCVVFSLSIVTLRRLSKPQAIQANLPEIQREQRRQRMASAVRMVLCSLLVYSVCYLPVIILNVLVTVLELLGRSSIGQH